MPHSVKSLYREPIVKVVGHTMFNWVPAELCADGAGYRYGQDGGSSCARLTECAGRTCYDSYGKGRPSAEYHQHILEVGHGSVLEHSTISFFISGVSRNLTHELVRHRAGCAISQRSTRYVDESESDWAWHPLMDKLSQTKKDHLGSLQVETQDLYAGCVADLEAILIAEGMDKLTARKQARGAARGVLGTCLETELVWTANLRALRNVIEQRCTDHADAEIRMLAFILWEKARTVCPEYFSDYQARPAKDGLGHVLESEHRKV